MDLSDPWSPLVPAAPGTVFRANHHSPICHLRRHGTCLASSASPSILALEISLLLLLESSHPCQPSLIFSTLTIFTIPCNNRGGGRVGGSAVGLSPICTTVSNGSCPGRKGAGPELPAWDPQSPSFIWALELGSSLPPPPLQATRGTVLLSPPNGHEKTMSSSLTNI